MDVSRTLVGDAERWASVEQINEAHALGRLDPDETEIRVSAALRARTMGELHLVTSDLPLQTSSAPGPVPSARVQRCQGGGGRWAFAAFCLVSGSVATAAATDSVVMGAISGIACGCGVVLGRFTTTDR